MTFTPRLSTLICNWSLQHVLWSLRQKWRSKDTHWTFAETPFTHSFITWTCTTAKWDFFGAEWQFKLLGFMTPAVTRVWLGNELQVYQWRVHHLNHCIMASTILDHAQAFTSNRQAVHDLVFCNDFTFSQTITTYTDSQFSSSNVCLYCLMST